MLKLIVPAVLFAGVAIAGDAPVFPVTATKSVATAVVPTGATHKIRSGKSGVRYLACNEQRAFPGGAIELHCLSFSTGRGWSRAERWYPRYLVVGIRDTLPADPTVTALR